MISDLPELFHDMDISDYKIFSYRIRQNRYSCTPEGVLPDLSRDISCSAVFFGSSGHIGRIDSAGANFSDIRKTVCRMIRNQEWYCEMIPGFFSDSLSLDLPAPSGPVLTADSIPSLYSGGLNITLARYIQTGCTLDLVTSKGSCTRFSEGASLQVMMEVMPGFPAREFVVKDPRDPEGVLPSLERQRDALLSQFRSAMLPTEEYRGAKYILAPEIAAQVIGFLCGALRGERVLSGTSFLSAGSFGRPLLNSSLSLFREHTPSGITAERLPGGRKYYIREGVPVSAFNDLHTAALLAQEDGDAVFDPDELKTVVSVENVHIEPAVPAEDVPVFDTIGGEQFMFNPLNGELNMLLKSSAGFHHHVCGSIIDLFNRVEGEVSLPGPDGEAGTGLLVRLQGS